jgi:hypothetical protein
MYKIEIYYCILVSTSSRSIEPSSLRRRVRLHTRPSTSERVTVTDVDVTDGTTDPEVVEVVSGLA